jgi:zinc protease
MRTTVRALALALMPVGSLQAQPAQTLSARATLVATVEGVSEYRLANGLRVLLIPDSSRPSVTLNAVYLVGSRNEGYGELGAAHMLEHLLLRGSRKHPDMQAEETRYGSVRNASTTVDNTSYFQTIPAIDSVVEWAIDLQADRMINAFVTRQNLATEFSVVRNELELNESTPATAARMQLFATAFKSHAYQRPIVGSVSDIENASIERLQAFYKRYYQPDNALLIASGRFSSARMLSLIEKKFGVIPRPVRSAALGNLLAVAATAEPPQAGEQYVAMRRGSGEQMLVLGYHTPGVAHPDYAALEVLADVMGSNPSGRLFKALVDTRQAAFLVGDVYSSADPSLIFFQARLRLDQSLDSVSARMARLVDSARTSPFTAEEVARARTSLLRNIDLAFGNTTLLAITLGDWSASGDWRLFFVNRDRLANVTPEDVQRVAAHYLKPTNRTTVALIPTEQPDRTVVPASPAIGPIVAGFKGRASAQTGELLDASPRVLESRVARTTLPSGMRVTLLPKRNRASKVNASVVVRFGTEQSLSGKALVSQLTGGMLMRGTMSLTRQALIDSLSKLTAAVTAGASGNTATVTVETIRPNLLPVLDLVAQILQTPRLDAEDLERYKKERLVQLDNTRGDPTQQALSAVMRQMAPRPVGHIFRWLLVDEQIQGVTAVTVDDVTAFHRQNYGGGAADFVAVGDFDAAELSAAVTRHFGEWRSPQPIEHVARPYVPSDSTLTHIEIPDKPNAGFAAATTLQLRDDDPDYPAVALAQFMVSGAQTSLLMNRLREREGLTYGVLSQLAVQPLDRYGTWAIAVLVAPKNIERLQQSFRDEIDRVVTRGVTADEFQIYREGLLQSRMQSRSTDRDLVTLLMNRRYAGRTLAYDDALDAAIAGLTVEQVNAALKKYLDPKRLVLGRAGDFVNNPPARPTP